MQVTRTDTTVTVSFDTHEDFLALPAEVRIPCYVFGKVAAYASLVEVKFSRTNWRGIGMAGRLGVEDNFD